MFRKIGKKIIALVVFSSILLAAGMTDTVSIAEEIDFDSYSIEELNAIIGKAYNALVKQADDLEDNQVLYTYDYDAWSVAIHSVEFDDGRLSIYPLIINNNDEDLKLYDVSCAINGWKLSVTLMGDNVLGGNQRTKSACYFYITNMNDAEITELEQIQTMELVFKVELSGYYQCRITVSLTYLPDVGLAVTSREWMSIL
ncbi:MAG: hypothetical protein IK127_00805 [Clostridia bacterium]|nr:hypothetical protein [Clostridia bacterium]